MTKSKLFAFIVGVVILGMAGVVYAQTSFAPPGLVIGKPIQPPSGLAPAGALRVPFTSFDLTARGADIVVEEIVVTRTGPSSDRVFEELVLMSGGDEELGEASLRADHTAHFDEPFVIPAGTTVHLTVAANMAEDLEEFEGQSPSLTVTAIHASAVVMVR